MFAQCIIAAQLIRIGGGVRCGGAMLRDAAVYCLAIAALLLAYGIGSVNRVFLGLCIAIYVAYVAWVFGGDEWHAAGRPGLAAALARARNSLAHLTDSLTLRPDVGAAVPPGYGTAAPWAAVDYGGGGWPPVAGAEAELSALPGSGSGRHRGGGGGGGEEDYPPDFEALYDGALDAGAPAGRRAEAEEAGRLLAGGAHPSSQAQQPEGWRPQARLLSAKAYRQARALPCGTGSRGEPLPPARSAPCPPCRSARTRPTRLTSLLYAPHTHALA